MDKESLQKLSHGHLNQYIKLADQKASIILSGQLAVLGLLLTVFQNLWAGTQACTQLLAGVTIVGVISSIILSIFVVIPREETNMERGYIYWEEILAHSDKNTFVKEMDKLSENEIKDHVSEDIYNLSNIASEKYRYLRFSLIATGGFLLLLAITIISYFS